MTSKLLAFGCSYTYGEGLEDCWNLKSKNSENLPPSIFAWPSILGENLNLEVQNLSIPGASNKLISHIILNTDISENDTVVILWTHKARHDILLDLNYYQRLLPSDKRRNTKTFFRDEFKFYINPGLASYFYTRFYNDLDFTIESLQKINHINYYLKSKKIKCYHFSIEEFNSEKIKWNDANITTVKFDKQLGKALDNSHPSAAAQEKLAREILEVIQNDH